MKIAILGTRGIPARYGGFETFAENLANNLVANGEEVNVYCRRPFSTAEDMVDSRIRRTILPTISNKFLDTAFHTLLSVCHVIFTDADVVLICNVANSPLAWIPRLAGKPTILNVDGLDRKRRKWNFVARSFLHFCEFLAAITPTRIVTDAQFIREYYWRRYGVRSVMIAYGAHVPPDDGRLESFDLPLKKYILYVSRLEPENNPELVLRAYREVKTEWPLVVVGGNTYNSSFVDKLKSLADGRVIFLGPVYGPRYWQLLRNAGIYVFGCEVGGVHPALIEAMAARQPVLYLDTPENRETAHDSGIPFAAEVGDLASHIGSLLGDAALREKLAQRASERAEARFGWEQTTQKYQALFAEVTGTR